MKGVLYYDGHETDPTIEGPKMYKTKRILLHFCTCRWCKYRLAIGIAE